MMRNVLRRIRLMIARAVVNLVDDAGGLQRVQLSLLDGETRDVERLQNYGFTSHPLPGAEAAVAFIGGDRGRGVVVAIDDRQFRLRNLAPGEVALYDDLGNVIHLKRDRILIDSGDLVEVVAPEVRVRATTKVRLETPLVEATQNMTVGGTLDVAGAVTMQSTAVVAGLATVGGLASTGVAGASSVSGDLEITGGDVTADGVSLTTHVHGGVTTGSGTTGAPQ